MEFFCKAAIAFDALIILHADSVDKPTKSAKAFCLLSKVPFRTANSNLTFGEIYPPL